MEVKTHITTSVTIAAGVSAFYALPFTASYLLGTVLGSVLPDLDKRDSFIGQKSFGLSRIVQLIFGHRGFTHSLFCWVLISIICLSYPSEFSYGFSIGYIAHIIGDFFSKRGVPLFYPIIKKPITPSSILSYKTGGMSETIIFMISFGILLYLFLDEALMSELVHSIEKWINLI